MIGSNLEPDIGSVKFLALYLLSGIGGVSFSALCTDTLSMGASTAVFGLSGCYVAFIILNYSYLSGRPDKLCQIVIFLLLSLFLTVMLGSKNIDVLGHLGGFLTGAILGHWIMPCLEPQGFKVERAKKFSFWSKIATAVWFALLIGCFYAFREPADKFSSAGVTVAAETDSEADADSLSAAVETGDAEGENNMA